MSRGGIWLATIVVIIAVLGAPAASQDNVFAKRESAAKAKSKQRAAEPTLRGAAGARARDEAAQVAKDRSEALAAEQRLEQATAELANFSIALFYATIGLFVVSASLWLLAYLQSRDMKAAVLAARESSAAARTSAEVAERGLVLTQRATVVVKEPKAIWLRGEEQELVGCRLFVTWHNVGHTPTKDMITAITGLALEKRPPPDCVMPKASPRMQTLVMGPSSVVNGSHINIPVELVHEIRERKAHYLFSGWAEYNDVFDNTPRHRVEFCYLVDFEGDGEARAMRALFQIHGKHNRQYDDPPRHLEQGPADRPQEQRIAPVARAPVDRPSADHASARAAPQVQPIQS